MMKDFSISFEGNTLLDTYNPKKHPEAPQAYAEYMQLSGEERKKVAASYVRPPVNCPRDQHLFTIHPEIAEHARIVRQINLENNIDLQELLEAHDGSKEPLRTKLQVRINEYKKQIDINLGRYIPESVREMADMF